jgi:hypothetical protein
MQEGETRMTLRDEIAALEPRGEDSVHGSAGDCAVTTISFMLLPHGAYGCEIHAPGLYEQILIAIREGGCAGERGKMIGAHKFLADICREVLTK